MDDVMSNKKFVIVGAGGSGFYDHAFADVMSLPNVEYIRYTDQCNTSVKAQKIVKYCSSYNPSYFSQKAVAAISGLSLFGNRFPDDENIVYLFTSRIDRLIGTALWSRFRRSHKKSKCVLYLFDIAATYHYLGRHELESMFDLIISYDQSDAKKNGWLYYPTPFSSVKGIQSDLPESDVYFCGSCKNRLKAIYDIYERLRMENLRCDFFLYGVKPEDQIYPEINYDKFLSYRNNLRHVLSSRSELEIMQQGAQGFTPRLWESLSFGKHLLSNNHSIRESRFYIENAIHFIDEVTSFSQVINKPSVIPSELVESMSPLCLLEYISNALDK